jgi:hypothetical protein
VQRLTIEDCHRLAKEHNGECLSEKYNTSLTKYEWKCINGHMWRTKHNNIQQGKWCPICAGNRKGQIEDCHELAELKNGKCLSTEREVKRI